MPRKKPLVHDNEQYAMSRGFGVNEFGKILESAMTRESKEKTKERFSPSSLGYSGSCPRRWWYAFNGAMFEYNTTPEALANMNAGSDAGVRLAKVLDDAGVLVDSEVWVENEDPPIGGYIDAVINWKNEEVVCEVKTTKDNTWNYRVQNNKVPGYQMLQLLIYLRLTGRDKGFFLTENKDSNKLFILPIKMNKEHNEFLDYVFDWMRKVKDNADHGGLPKRPFAKTSMECKGCEMRTECWSGFTKATKARQESDENPGVVDLPPLIIPK